MDSIGETSRPCHGVSRHGLSEARQLRRRDAAVEREVRRRRETVRPRFLRPRQPLHRQGLHRGAGRVDDGNHQRKRDRLRLARRPLAQGVAGGDDRRPADPLEQLPQVTLRDNRAVCRAWAEGEIHVDPRQMLRGDDFAGDSKAWWLQVAKPSVATLRPLAGGGPEGRPGVVLDSDRASQKTAFVILQQAGLKIEKNCRYKLAFSACADVKAGDSVKLQVSVSMSHVALEQGRFGGIGGRRRPVAAGQLVLRRRRGRTGGEADDFAPARCEPRGAGRLYAEQGGRGRAAAAPSRWRPATSRSR